MVFDVGVHYMFMMQVFDILTSKGYLGEILMCVLGAKSSGLHVSKVTLPLQSNIFP